MNTDMQTNQNSRQQNLYNCPNVIIGDNNVINLFSSEVQGNPTGNSDQQCEKVPSFLPSKPFHVSCIRKKELKDIDSLFSSMTRDGDHKNVVRTVYLTGPPGAGKTQLARQYAKQFLNTTSRNCKSTPMVITLNANSEESLVRSVKDVAPKLEFVFENMELRNGKLLDKLKNYLHDYNGTWLLIVDDMFENSRFNNLFPRPGCKEWGGGFVLVTTQDGNIVPACHEFAKKYSVKKGMTKEDALALLTVISEVEADDNAEEIVEELHYLPLALACCATYVGETRLARPSMEFGWKEYLNHYRENGQLESRTFSNNNSVYPFSTAAAATMAINRMGETSDVLRLTFSFLSYCAFLPVPLSVLVHYVKANLPEQNSKQPTTKEIENEISRCTLLVHERSAQNVETIKCHQVIHCAFQSVEKTRPAEQREVEFIKMMKSLNETLDFMDNTSKKDVVLKVLMRPHLQSFMDNANDMSWNTTAEFVLISMNTGQFLFSTSNMPDNEAVKSLELLYNISLELDLSDERRCDILANLGFYYLELDRDEDALNFLCKAYSMTEGKSENEWLLLRCRISYNLARAYCSADSVELGIEMMRKSIELAKVVYVNEEDKIMNRYFWLADFHLSWDKFWKLGEIGREAREFLSSYATGSVSLRRASCLSEMSSICMYIGFIESIFKPWSNKHISLAEDFLSQSLTIYQQVLREDVSLCTELSNVLTMSALIKLQKKKPTEARTQLEKALQISILSDDKFNHSMIIAYKKHLFNDLSWWRCLLWWIRNVSKGQPKFAAVINIFDDILEDYRNGKISPSRRIVKEIERRRTLLVWFNRLLTFQLGYVIWNILF